MVTLVIEAKSLWLVKEAFCRKNRYRTFAGANEQLDLVDRRGCLKVINLNHTSNKAIRRQAAVTRTPIVTTLLAAAP